MVGTSLAFSKCSILSGPGFKRASNELRWVRVPRAGAQDGSVPSISVFVSWCGLSPVGRVQSGPGWLPHQHSRTAAPTGLLPHSLGGSLGIGNIREAAASLRGWKNRALVHSWSPRSCHQWDSEILYRPAPYITATWRVQKRWKLSSCPVPLFACWLTHHHSPWSPLRQWAFLPF